MKREMLLAASLGAVLAAGAVTAETRVALVPGGPHPFFANWEGGGVEAVKDFGVAASDYRVPQEWKLDHAEQDARKPGLARATTPSQFSPATPTAPTRWSRS